MACYSARRGKGTHPPKATNVDPRVTPDADDGTTMNANRSEPKEYGQSANRSQRRAPFESPAGVAWRADEEIASRRSVDRGYLPSPARMSRPTVIDLLRVGTSYEVTHACSNENISSVGDGDLEKVAIVGSFAGKVPIGPALISLLGGNSSAHPLFGLER